MRLMTVGIGGLALLAIALVYYVFWQLPAVHIARLVPENDFTFGVFYSSVDDLRALYDVPGARRDTDPGRLRLGERVNVPELDGVSQFEPFGVYWNAAPEEIHLVPVLDFGAFEDAFETSRENLNLRAPERPASNYASLCVSTAEARRQGRDNPLVLRATEYPLALAAHPDQAETVRFMLWYLLRWEAPRKAGGVPLLVDEVRRLPDAVAGFFADETDELLLGFAPVEDARLPARVDLELAPRPGGTLAHAAAAAGGLGLQEVLAAFPRGTVLLAGAALDRAGWESVGSPLDAGGAAIACGIVERRHATRRYTVLLVVRPRDPAALEALRRGGAAALLGAPETGMDSVDDEGTEVRRAVLDGPPPGTEVLLRSDAEHAPPVYVAHAVENGLWLFALGTQAEGVVRHALGCLRHPDLSIRGDAPVSAHPGFMRDPHVAAAVVTAAGLRAFRHKMPLFEVASLAQPKWITFVLDARDGKLTGGFRIAR